MKAARMLLDNTVAELVVVGGITPLLQQKWTANRLVNSRLIQVQSQCTQFQYM